MRRLIVIIFFYMGNALDDYTDAITSTMSSRWALNEFQRVRLKWLIRRIGPESAFWLLKLKSLKTFLDLRLHIF